MIAIGSDHGGYKLKEEIKRYLEEKEIEYEDCGTFSKDRVDYPEIAKTVALEIQNKQCDKGILICRSGIGMSIVANKFKG
ncbi:MAG: RpiB/LacA/LacB family sugar-phosphate isomerase, partial [Clostridia bacterium]